MALAVLFTAVVVALLVGGGEDSEAGSASGTTTDTTPSSTLSSASATTPTSELPAESPPGRFGVKEDGTARWAAVVPDTPLRYDPMTDRYEAYNLYGTALYPVSALDLTVELEVEPGTGAGATQASGLVLTNDQVGENLRGILLVREVDRWGVRFQKGNQFPVSDTFEPSEARRERFEVSFAADFSSVEVTRSDGEILTVDLGEPAFAGSGAEYVRFRALVAPRSIVDLHELRLVQAPGGAPEQAGLDAPSLADAGRRAGVEMGVSQVDLAVGSPVDERLVARHSDIYLWHLFTPSDPANPRAALLETQSQLAFAKAQELRVRAHPLIWHEGMAPVISEGDWTRDQLLGIMQTLIAGTMAAYPQVDEWVVVNEAMASDGFRDTFWQRIIGDDYVRQAFAFARAADPDAVLIYNDFDIEYPGPKADQTFAMVAAMQAAGVPIDGVGSQVHIGVGDDVVATRAEMSTEMARYRELGLPVHITELDVNLTYFDGDAAGKAQFQADLYADIVGACLASANCPSIVFWGYVDTFSWLAKPQFAYLGGGEAPLIFDANRQPKPAFWATLGALVTSDAAAAIDATPLVEPDEPFTMAADPTDYRQLAVPGARFGLDSLHGLEIDLEVAVAASAENSSTGLLLTNGLRGADQRAVPLIHLDGGWAIQQQVGTEYPQFVALGPSPGPSARAFFQVASLADGRWLAVRLGDERPVFLDLGEERFGPVDEIRVDLLAAPGAAATLHSFVVNRS